MLECRTSCMEDRSSALGKSRAVTAIRAGSAALAMGAVPPKTARGASRRRPDLIIRCESTSVCTSVLPHCQPSKCGGHFDDSAERNAKYQTKDHQRRRTPSGLRGPRGTRSKCIKPCLAKGKVSSICRAWSSEAKFKMNTTPVPSCLTYHWSILPLR